VGFAVADGDDWFGVRVVGLRLEEGDAFMRVEDEGRHLLVDCLGFHLGLGLGRLGRLGLDGRDAAFRLAAFRLAGRTRLGLCSTPSLLWLGIFLVCDGVGGK
jgi:hypothetical protein